MRSVTLALITVLVTAGAVPIAFGQAVEEGEGYDGTHLSLEIDDRAVTNYAVGDERVAASIRMQAVADVTNGSEGDLELSGVSNLGGAAIQSEQEGEADMTVMTPTAQLVAHDNPRGVFVVQPDEPQYVQIDLASEAEVTDETDSAITVTTENGTEGTFFLIGDGDLTVNQNDSVVSRVEDDSRLVFRAYPGGKSDDHERQERLIRNEQAIADVYVMGSGVDSTVDTVAYATGASVTGEQADPEGVQVNVDYPDGEGGIVMTSISTDIVAADGLVVAVDDEELAAAASYDELESAVGGDRSQYLVAEGSGGEASTDVLVAVDEFSGRTTIGIRSAGEDADGGGNDGDGNENNG